MTEFIPIEIIDLVNFLKPGEKENIEVSFHQKDRGLIVGIKHPKQLKRTEVSLILMHLASELMNEEANFYGTVEQAERNK